MPATAGRSSTRPRCASRSSGSRPTSFAPRNGGGRSLRDKQEQLVQAGKLATLGELTTGVAHELNNPLNNIGLYVGNVIDRIRLGEDDTEPLVLDLEKAMEQVHKATEIISHLR